MEINYTYKITESTEQSMVIEYSSEGLPTIPVAVPTPKEGEYPTVQEAVAHLQSAYAPIAMWRELYAARMQIAVGLEGEATANLIVPANVDQIEPAVIPMQATAVETQVV